MRFHSPLSSPLFSDPTWSMAFGERAALLALVSDLRPDLALEVGTYHGGAPRTIARWSGVFHDTANGAVRGALEDLDLPQHPKVAAAILDHVPGYLVRADAHASAGEQWNGLGLVILDENPPRPVITNEPPRENVADVYRAFRERSAA